MTRILVVDDDEIGLAVVRNALAHAGHEVLTAGNGEEALAVLRREDVRLVITDWEMPVLDGLDLCRAIRRRDGGYVYVILLTSHGSSAAIVAGMSAGADDFIVKPFNQAELMARVRAGERVLGLETREMVIFALAKLAESRDSDTGQHLERVQSYSRKLAEALMDNRGLRGRGRRRVRAAGVSDEPAARHRQSRHPRLRAAEAGPAERPRIRHHEVAHAAGRADARGGARKLSDGAVPANGPRHRARRTTSGGTGSAIRTGLQGTDIPLAARIVAVADVYDALTSKRVYKGSFTHTVAREIILGDSGTHFDPDVVEAFLDRRVGLPGDSPAVLAGSGCVEVRAGRGDLILRC